MPHNCGPGAKVAAVIFFEMRFALLLSAAGLLALAAPLGAQAAGDIQKAQTIFQEGSARIASRFNGASCPNVKAPTP